MGLAKATLAGLEERLHDHAGFDLPSWVVEARALARMGALGLGESAYLELVNSPAGAGELRALVEAVRVGETSFFRHRPQVDALLSVVVPAWRERDQKAPRVWSAGCATGEEPYTLALVLARALPRPAFTPTILATDVSAEALAVAERAAYPAAAADDVPAPWREGLVTEGPAVRVRPEIAALVRFRQQNLADADAPRGFDLVWCRNVLIYFGPEARRRVLDRLVGALQPGGFLFVGYSETLRDVAGLTAVRWADQVLWQKPLGGQALTASGRPPASVAQGLRSSGIRDDNMRVKAPISRAPGALVKVPVGRDAGGLSRAPLGGGARSVVKAPGAPAPGKGRSAVMRLTDAEPGALAAEIRSALGAAGLGTLTIDLDGAEFIEDAIAPVLRRACAAAESAGIEILLRATRPGPQRWLRRNGLAGGES